MDRPDFFFSMLLNISWNVIIFIGSEFDFIGGGIGDGFVEDIKFLTRNIIIVRCDDCCCNC